MGVKAFNSGFGGLPGYGHSSRKGFGSVSQTQVSVTTQTATYGQAGRGKGFGGFRNFGGHNSFSGGYSASSFRATDGFGRTSGHDSFRNFGDFGSARGSRSFGKGFGGYGKGFGGASFGGFNRGFGAPSFGGFNHFSNLAQTKNFGGFGASSFGRVGGYGAGGGGEFRSVQTWGDARGLSDFGFHRPGGLGQPTVIGGYGPGGGGEFRRAAVYEGFQSFGGFSGRGAQFGGFQGFQGFQSHAGFGGHKGGFAPAKSYDVAVDPRASAGYDNAIGAYEVTPRGDIVNARLIAPSAHDAEGGKTRIDGVRPGNQLGFFIMQDGADLASRLGSGDKLSFRNEDGGRANLADGSPILAINGKPVDQTVFHSLGASLNHDGIKHARVGSNGFGKTVAFEDLTGGGDRDFNDVILHVKPNRAGFWS